MTEISTATTPVYPASYETTDSRQLINAIAGILKPATLAIYRQGLKVVNIQTMCV